MPRLCQLEGENQNHPREKHILQAVGNTDEQAHNSSTYIQYKNVIGEYHEIAY